MSKHNGESSPASGFLAADTGKLPYGSQEVFVGIGRMGGGEQRGEGGGREEALHEPDIGRIGGGPGGDGGDDGVGGRTGGLAEGGNFV